MSSSATNPPIALFPDNFDTTGDPTTWVVGWNLSGARLTIGYDKDGYLLAQLHIADHGTATRQTTHAQVLDFAAKLDRLALGNRSTQESLREANRRLRHALAKVIQHLGSELVEKKQMLAENERLREENRHAATVINAATWLINARTPGEDLEDDADQNTAARELLGENIYNAIVATHKAQQPGRGW